MKSIDKAQQTLNYLTSLIPTLTTMDDCHFAGTTGFTILHDNGKKAFHVSVPLAMITNIQWNYRQRCFEERGESGATLTPTQVLDSMIDNMEQYDLAYFTLDIGTKVFVFTARVLESELA